jgi:hypothetical protein
MTDEKRLDERESQEDSVRGPCSRTAERAGHFNHYIPSISNKLRQRACAKELKKDISKDTLHPMEMR